MTEAQIALAARYGVEAPFPPDHTIPPAELFPDKPACVVRQEDGDRTLVRVRIGDVVTGRRVRDRAIVVQQKTRRPVQFELMDTARRTIRACWSDAAAL